MKFLTSYFVVLFVLKLTKNAIFNVPILTNYTLHAARNTHHDIRLKTGKVPNQERHAVNEKSGTKLL